MKTMRLLTAGLKAAQLDWALAKALGLNPQIKLNTVWVQKTANGVPFGGSTPFNHANPTLCLNLIKQWITEIKKPCDEDPWFVACGAKNCNGDALEETVARCVVTTWFGEWVEMPIELCSMDVL